MKNQPKSFSVKKILILVTILALPGFCYYLLQEKGENRYKSLPFYGEKQLSGTYHTKRGKKIPDTTYHVVKPFTMLNSDNDSVTFKPDSGIALVSFFHLGNKLLESPINQAMRRIAERFQKNGMVRLYSITVDPILDSARLLDNYKVKNFGQYNYWNFLIGKSREDVSVIAQREFLLDVIYDPKDTTAINHSSAIVLLDSHRRIRGYYDALAKDEVDKVIDEVKLLLTEEFRNISVNKNE